jgi:hypothetical protein
MSFNNYTVALETNEKSGDQYRITNTMDFGDLYFSYIDNNTHSEVIPTRLIEFFEDSKIIHNEFPNNISVLFSHSSWENIKSEARVYADKEIKAIIRRKDRNEIKDVIPMLGRIAYGDIWNNVITIDDLINESEYDDVIHNDNVDETLVNKEIKKPYCVELDKVFDSLKIAGKELKIRCDHISECCRGKRQSAGKHPVTGEKLHWQYCEG